jgi:hypothetical protein
MPAGPAGIAPLLRLTLDEHVTVVGSPSVRSLLLGVRALVGSLLGLLAADQLSNTPVITAIGVVTGLVLFTNPRVELWFRISTMRHEGGSLPSWVSRDARKVDRTLLATRFVLGLTKGDAERAERVVGKGAVATRTSAREATVAGYGDDVLEVLRRRASSRGRPYVREGWSRLLDAGRQGVDEGEALGVSARRSRRPEQQADARFRARLTTKAWWARYLGVRAIGAALALWVASRALGDVSLSRTWGTLVGASVLIAVLEFATRVPIGLLRASRIPGSLLVGLPLLAMAWLWIVTSAFHGVTIQGFSRYAESASVVLIVMVVVDRLWVVAFTRMRTG